MIERRRFLLGLLAAPQAFYTLSKLSGWDRKPSFTELLKPGLYNPEQWQAYDEFETRSIKYTHVKYSVGFRITKELLEDLPQNDPLKCFVEAVRRI